MSCYTEPGVDTPRGANARISHYFSRHVASPMPITRHNSEAESLESERLPSQSDSFRLMGNKRMLLSLVLVGLGSMVPFNMLINAVDLFTSVYGHTSIEYWLALVFVLPQVAVDMVLSNAKMQSRPRPSAQVVTWALALSALACSSIPMVIMAAPVHISWYTVVGIACMTGVLSCLMQTCLTSYAAILPRPFLKVLMGGQTCSAVFAFGLHVATKGLVANVRHGGVVYLCTCSCFMLLSAMAFWYFKGRPMSRFLLAKAQSSNMLSDDGYSISVMSEEGGKGQRLPEWGTSPVRSAKRLGFWGVAAHMKTRVLALLTVLFVTFSLYPGLLTEFWFHGEPTTATHFLVSWWPIIMIGIACVGDMIGRLTAKSCSSSLGPPLILAIGALRLGFIPAFVFYLKGWFPMVLSNGVIAAAVAAYAVSNGVLTSSAMVLPQVLTADPAAMIRVLMVFFRLGMVGGTAFSLVLRQLM